MNMRRGGGVTCKGPRGRRRSKEEDDDDEYVVGDEEMESSEESLISSRDASAEEGLEIGDSSSEEVVEIAAPKRPVRGAWRRGRTRVSDGEEEVGAPRRRRSRGVARGGTRRRRSRFSDQEDDDEDFDPDEDEEGAEEEEDEPYEEEEEEVSPVARKKRGRLALIPCARKKGRSKNSKSKRIKKKTTRVPPKKRPKRVLIPDEDDDDDFVAKPRVLVSDRRKVVKKKNRTLSNSRRRRKKSSESESSDYDFVVSDEDLEDLEDLEVEENRTNKKKTRSTARRKIVSESSMGSESSDFDDERISEEELRDLGVGGLLNLPQPKRIFAGRKEEKGKEKEVEDPGKQVCGICLSEEQKRTVQGVLDCCAHYFCVACIIEWSKVESRCPVCKRRFSSISKSGGLLPTFGLRTGVIMVPKRDQVYQPSEEEMRGFLNPYDNVVCMECQRGGDDCLMLLCDICDSPAHTYCVGLGREVPEGNWYCEVCRLASDASTHLPVQDTPTGQGADTSDLFPGHFSDGIETDVATSLHSATNSQPVSLRIHVPSLNIDLNASPRQETEEEIGSTLHTPGAGASTLSGRRAIQRRIRIMLSTNRPGQIFRGRDVPRLNVESEVVNSEVERDGEGANTCPAVSGVAHRQQSSSAFFQHNSIMSPSINGEGTSSRPVEGAKDQVQSMVKRHLKSLSRNSPLERSTFKQILRHSTHTILAACGMKHKRNMVVGPVQSPSICSHESVNGSTTTPMEGCCSSCFSSFVKDVVQKIIDTRPGLPV